MIDTHAHIYLEDFQDDVDAVISRAQAIGVKKILMPNIDVHSIKSMLALEKKYPEFCYAMMGLHPCYVKVDFKKQLEVVEGWFDERTFLAVGEIGTDLYWDKSFWEYQKQAFDFQCDLALKHNLPIVIHCRESIDETIELVGKYSGRGLRGVFHCFTGTIQQAKAINQLGFWIGLGGVSTFKNSGMDQVIPHIEHAKIVIETDAPYLAPTPKRGKRNEPAYVDFVAEKVAGFLSMEKAEFINLTEENTNALFFNP